MKPVKFKGQNCTFAVNQPEYLPLPAHRVENSERGEVIFCGSASFKERIKILFTGRIWCSLLMFGKPLTPSFFTGNKWEMFNKKVFKEYCKKESQS